MHFVKVASFILMASGLCGGAPALKYSSYFGGAGDDSIAAIALDSAGNIYVAGTAASGNFPVTPGAVQSRIAGPPDAFVAKFDASGKVLIFCTFLGGSGRDAAHDLAVDAAGNVYITGVTYSADFPVTPGAFRTSSTGGAFVAKLNPAGTALVYSTYIDSVRAEGYGIAVDGSGNAYITGTTFSSDFPTTPGAFQRTAKSNDVFVAKLNPAGAALVYATLVGGDSNEAAARIAVDRDGNAYVVGGGSSSNFPVTAGAFQTAKGAGDSEDAFVFKLKPDGSGLAYSTYLGGSGPEGAFDVAIDSSGNAYATGITYSENFPATAGAFQRTYGGNGDAFAAKLSADGARLVYSTFLGGAKSDSGAALALGPGDEVIVTGQAAEGFPATPDAIRRSVAGSTDLFVTRLGADGSSVRFSTVLGGGDNDAGTSVAVSPAGDLYVAGTTLSNDFPVTPDAFDTTYNGGASGDAFIARIGEASGSASLATVSAASYAQDGTVAPGSIASGFGENLANALEAASSVPLPEVLGGVSVRVKDSAGTEHAAPLFFVSPGQINYLVPAGARTGPATVAVLNQGTPAAQGSLTIDAVAPALFSMNRDGRGVAAAFALRVAADGTQTAAPVFTCGTAQGSCVPAPIDPGAPDEQVILLLYGTGIRGRSALDKVRTTICGVDAETQYAGAQSEYPGLDQVNVHLPRSLAGRGACDIVLTADARAANIVTVSIR